MALTSVQNDLLTYNGPYEGAKINSQAICVLTPNTPSGLNLGESNASIAFGLTFYALLPLSSLSENVMSTSGIVKCPAIVMAFNRFLNASFLGYDAGI